LQSSIILSRGITAYILPVMWMTSYFHKTTAWRVTLPQQHRVMYTD